MRAAIILFMSTCSAMAAPPMVLHNGSLMQLVEGPPQTIRIFYAQPRPDLFAIGIRPGTLLIDGRWVGSNSFIGNARVFSSMCGALPYPVEGRVAPDGTLEMRGPAPIVDWHCQLLGYEWTGNSYLQFTTLK